MSRRVAQPNEPKPTHLDVPHSTTIFGLLRREVYVGELDNDLELASPQRECRLVVADLGALERLRLWQLDNLFLLPLVPFFVAHVVGHFAVPRAGDIVVDQNAARRRLLEVGQNALERRDEALEDGGEDWVERRMVFRVQIVDVRRDGDLALLVDIEVRWQPLVLLRRRVQRVARLGRCRVAGDLAVGAKLANRRHTVAEREERGVNEVEHLIVGPRVPVGLAERRVLLELGDVREELIEQLLGHKRVGLVYTFEAGRLHAVAYGEYERADLQQREPRTWIPCGSFSFSACNSSSSST